MTSQVATCVWRITPEIVLALQEHFGDPLDTYVNGSQVWLIDNGPNEITLQWRLHPVAGYKRPATESTETVFTSTAFAIRNQEALPAPLDQLWDGLEAWPAFNDKVDPEELGKTAGIALGIEPDKVGMVDHETIGRRWEEQKRNISIVEMIFDQLEIGL